MSNAMPTTSDTSASTDSRYLSDQQIAYFNTFGYLKIPGLFADDVDTLCAGFEAVFADNAQWITNEELHYEQQRAIIPAFITKDERLHRLLEDERVVDIVSSLVGPGYEYAESDGNIFSCDTSWHSDIYAAPLQQYHLKLSFYLDPLRQDTGAIRFIPGTNHFESAYARTLRRDLMTPTTVHDTFGLPSSEIPSWTVETDPGDLVIWNFRTIHGSFGGGGRRRLFSINFREPATPAAAGTGA
jgi:Phytanoyl-CoA dioxygenase (PhyH)